MVLTDPVFLECLAVLEGAIALIAFPIIVWKFPMQATHIGVAPGLGQYAGRGDAGIDAVAFYYTFMSQGLIRTEAIAVDQQEGRFLPQLIDGHVHGLEGGLKNIDLVDLVVVYHGNGIGNGVRTDIDFQFLSFLRRQQFAVIELGMIEVAG